jgi:hypothetical protein
LLQAGIKRISKKRIKMKFRLIPISLFFLIIDLKYKGEGQAVNGESFRTKRYLWLLKGQPVKS